MRAGEDIDAELSAHERMELAAQLSGQLVVAITKPEPDTLWHIEAGMRQAADEWQEAVQHLANFDESKLLQEGGLVRADLVAEVERAEAVLQVFLKAEIAKVNGICHIIRSWRGEIAEAATEKKRVARIEAAKQNALNQLMGFVLSVMQQMGERKLTTPTNTLRIQKNPAALEVFDVLAVPAEFMNVTVKMPLNQWRAMIEVCNRATGLADSAMVFDLTSTADNADIRAALKEGKEVAGCRMTQGESLRVA